MWRWAGECTSYARLSITLPRALSRQGFLHFGHTLVIESSFDAERFLGDVDRYRVTSIHMVPTHFHRLLRLPDDVCAAYDLSSSGLLIHGGAPCPILIKQKMLDWLGPIIWEYFGCNEGWVSRVGPQEWIERPGTMGKSLPGSSVLVVDDDDGEVLRRCPRCDKTAGPFRIPARFPSHRYR
ncbi:AMP-binding protein [Nocardia sp. NBC_01377]|uniref:AMP-binding protein n=1 Tax=Nocardia sp. NBC_01377 TaxID=2903595 RepID=UPI0032440918